MSEYTNFLKLKDEGDKAESMFKDFLESKGYTNIVGIDEVYEEEGLNRSDWDVRGTNDLGITLTFEVKAAFECDRFGWTTVEIVQNGVPGGIAVSNADYYVHVNEELGFAIDLKSKLFDIYRELRFKATKMDYSRKKEIILNSGQPVKLWKTKFKNWAAGFRVHNSTLTWYD